MVSNALVNSEQCCDIEPRIYRVSELADALGIHRNTVERMIDRFNLQHTEIRHRGRLTKAIIIEPADTETVSEYARSVRDDSGSSDIVEQSGEMASIVAGNAQGNDQHRAEQSGAISIQEYRDITARLLEAETAKARLEGELKRADELIASKQQTITTLEKTLQATLILEGGRQAETLQFGPIKQGPPDRLGFLGRVRWLLTGKP